VGEYRSSPAKRVGISLAETLVVIAVIGLLLVILLPAVMSSREAARKTECASNIRQLALAMHAHEAEKSSLPGHFLVEPSGWSIELLPFIEQKPLYHRLDFSLPLIPHNWDHLDSRPPVYLCPSSEDRESLLPPVKIGSYAFNGLLAGMRIGKTERASSSLILLQKSERCIPGVLLLVIA
jgi:hypothetical protein